MGPGARAQLRTRPGRRGERACVRLLAACFARALQIRLPLFQSRGCRECRVHAAPAVSCAKNCTVGAHEHTGQRKHSDIPCAMALRLISRSPRWSGLVVTVTCELLHKLSASVAAPGPHDFAVRLRSFVRACAPEQKRPPHLIPTYSDDGRRPSSGMRRRSCNSDLQNCEAKYF